jgi:hypothetical protein
VGSMCSVTPVMGSRWQFEHMLGRTVRSLIRTKVQILITATKIYTSESVCSISWDMSLSARNTHRRVLGKSFGFESKKESNHYYTKTT